MFKSIGIAILMVPLTVSAWAVVDIPTGRPVISNELQFEFKAIPPTENAVTEWRKVSEDKVALSEQDKTVIAYRWTPAAPKPADSDIDTLQSRLKRNQQVLEMGSKYSRPASGPDAVWSIPELK